MVGAGPSRVGPWWGVPQPQGQAVPRLCGDSKSCSIPRGALLQDLWALSSGLYSQLSQCW